MTVRPKYTKRDLNQKQIVKELRELGAIVWDLANSGGYIMDTFVGFRGYWIPVEIKSPGGQLTLAQRQSIAGLEFCGLKCIVAESTQEILDQWPDRG